MVDRKEYKILQKRIQEPIKFIQVIAGPRQVGKTTMARAVSHQYDFPVHFVSADDTPEASTVWIEQQWENARLKIMSYMAVIRVLRNLKVNLQDGKITSGIP